jgi:hypothetical protein
MDTPHAWILGELRYQQGRWIMTSIRVYSEANPTHMRDMAHVQLAPDDVFRGPDFHQASRKARAKLEFYRGRFPGVAVQGV